MRAIKSLDTILLMSSCLQISEIPVTIKGRISYHNESNQNTFCLHMCSRRLIVNKKKLGHAVKDLRFDTILLVSSCHLIPEIPIKKGRISYHNESN